MREITITLSDDDARRIAERDEIVSDVLAATATGRAMQAIQAELADAEEPDPEWVPQVGDIVRPNWEDASFVEGVLVAQHPSHSDDWACVGFDANGRYSTFLPWLHCDDAGHFTFVDRPRTA